MEPLLRNFIDECLENYAVDNAIFLAERLCAESKSEENISYLAKAYLRGNQPHAAYAVTNGTVTPRNRYLFATAAFQMDKLEEAENALLPRNDGRIPNGAFGCLLLGQICRRTNRAQQAAEYFSQSISLNPMMWTAYENLCQLGQDIEAEHCFGRDTLSRLVDLRKEHVDGSSLIRPSINLSQNTSFTPLPPHPPAALAALDVHSTPGNNNSSARNIFVPSPALDTTPLDVHPVRRLHQYVTPSPPELLGTPPQMGGGFKAPRHKMQRTLLEQRLSHSSSLSSIPTSANAPRRRTDLSRRLQEATSSTTASEFTVSFSPSTSLSSTALSPDVPAGAGELFDLLTILGNAYRHRCMCRSQDAVNEFRRLPPPHLRTGWVLSEIGHAFFDGGKYADSEAAFREGRRIEPYRLAGLEIYSTVLWFLKREHELAALAQQVVTLSRHAPQTWCVLGNCFSLQREFETALKFFQRAVQIDPTFAYGYTLAGHEHVSNENFDKATQAFRTAIRCNDRHYNAWYGLGTIYLKQEKYDLAEYHFERASAHNPQNAVLYCSLGMALLANNNAERALDVLYLAKSIDPKNPLVKLKSAMALTQLGRLEEALIELETLQQLAPREATVYVQIGKIHKSLGNTSAALMNFTHALDLDPKSGNMLKAAIEKLRSPDAMDDDSL